MNGASFFELFERMIGHGQYNETITNEGVGSEKRRGKEGMDRDDGSDVG